MSDSGSLSDISISSQSKTKTSQLSDTFRDGALSKGLKAVKRGNKNAKKFILKGREHKSSTVAEHTNVVSVQLLDTNGEYLGSAHIDEAGNAYPNDNFKKNAEKAKK